MKVREVKKFVKEELGEFCLRTKWRRHTGMLEMYVRDAVHEDWHEVISIDMGHLRGNYSDNLLKANLRRSCSAILKKYGSE